MQQVLKVVDIAELNKSLARVLAITPEEAGALPLREIIRRLGTLLDKRLA